MHERGFFGVCYACKKFKGEAVRKCLDIDIVTAILLMLIAFLGGFMFGIYLENLI